jgi:hypothetical protein
MKKILVLDTNFLLIPYGFKIDIFGELYRLVEGAYTIVVPTVVKQELEKIASRKGRHALGARLALKLLDVHAKEIEFVESGGYADRWILTYAKEKRAIVCTNDTALRMKSKRADLRTITMKSRAKIGMV